MPADQHTEPVDHRPGDAAISSLSRSADTGRVGAQHVLNAEYFKRIDALNYTMMHDDGQHVRRPGRCRRDSSGRGLALRRRRLRSISPTAASAPRTCRWCQALPFRHQLQTLTKPLVVSLHATPERLIQVRQNRLLSMGDRG